MADRELPDPGNALHLHRRRAARRLTITKLAPCVIPPGPQRPRRNFRWFLRKTCDQHPFLTSVRMIFSRGPVLLYWCIIVRPSRTYINNSLRLVVFDSVGGACP